MSLSSVCVVLNALRLRFFKAGHSPAPCPDGVCPVPAEVRTVVLHVSGMTCSHCTGRVAQALEALDVEAEVSLDAGTARVRMTRAVPDRKLRKAVEDAGYPVTSIEQPEI